MSGNEVFSYALLSWCFFYGASSIGDNILLLLFVVLRTFTIFFLLLLYFTFFAFNVLLLLLFFLFLLSHVLIDATIIVDGLSDFIIAGSGDMSCLTLKYL